MSTVKLNNVRLAFPALFQPKTVNGEGEPRHSAAFPIAPGSDNAKALDAAIKAVASAKWGAKAAAILGELEAKGRVAYKKSPLSKDGEVYGGFEGCYTLNASNKARPTIVDRDRTPLVEADGRPYAGCYVVAIVELWAQDNSWGKRINATLKGVQFFADGEAFAGGVSASASDFDDLSMDEMA
ncbi:MAG: hypothetical protein RIR91_353 [Verrucomicrobiota bacterium]|jgi:hypothetical protein